MTVSIIIAVKTWQKNLEECVGKCLELDFPDFEILILPDSDADFPIEMKGHSPTNQGLSPGNDLRDRGLSLIKVIPTADLKPGEKRDKAIDAAQGEILAIIDDDTYPNPDWLKKAIRNFSDPDIAAVGGPAITPLEDGPMQKASGLVYSCPLVSGKFIYRYTPKKRQFVDDYPSSNFLIRKSMMQELGGFQTKFWPGEDTILCLKIIKNLKKKIVYDPEVIVYHHRRELFGPHLKQIASYALHRGYFVKHFPETSRKVIYYYLPSVLVVYLIAAAATPFLSKTMQGLYLAGLFFYLLLVLIFSLITGRRMFVPVSIGIVLSHFTYGIYFLKGIFSSSLKEEIINK